MRFQMSRRGVMAVASASDIPTGLESRHMATAAGEGADVWDEPQAALEARLASGPGGLSSAAAQQRLATFGRNTVAERRRRPLVLQLLLRFRNPLILLLLAARPASGLTGEIRGFVVPGLMVVMSVVLDFVQETRADRAAERLGKSAGVRAGVLGAGNHPRSRRPRSCR